MLLSIVSVQVGQAFGKGLFGAVPPMGVATLRLGSAAVLLLALHRARAPRDRRTLGLAVVLGTAIAGMNLIYPALEHLPVGVAVSVQFLGPLAVALAGARRRRDVLWALLAGGGVVLFLPAIAVGASATALALALGSAVSWAGYILAVRRLGARTLDGAVLAPAVAWAAVVVAPVGIASSGAALWRPGILVAGAGVGALSAVLPYSLDLIALRHLPPRVFGVLGSFEPVLGGVAGLAVLGERLQPIQWVAIGCVVSASIGTVTAPPDRRDDRRGSDR